MVLSLAEETGRSLLATRPRLERLLRENLVPFWVSRCLDGEHGGFHAHFGADGDSLGPHPKFLVTQARLTWFFARLARLGLLPQESARLAAHGSEFLLTRLQDPESGGYFWSVTHDGRAAVEPEKRVYGHAFALFALAEAARLPGMAGLGEPAIQLEHLIREQFRDPRFGGYFRSRSRCWNAPGDPGGYWDGRIKSLNDHLHIMEALIALQDLPGSTVANGALAEALLAIMTVATDPTTGHVRERFEADWTPSAGPVRHRTSYGHEVEVAWMIPLAAECVGLPPGMVLGPSVRTMRHALHTGWDRRRGGLFASGREGRRADRRDKPWWVQAEGLLAGLSLYLRTGLPEFAEFYLTTLRWIEESQVDWAVGDWHHTVHPTGKVSGSKGDAWRDPYHQGRALMECLELLGPA
ncbi:MAG TPA: AGE family epimerase/isomerase [Gemmatimonadales bacterium]|nr:AGE family epimerase/isomerase [Gemmatimonadales bacterium]